MALRPSRERQRRIDAWKAANPGKPIPVEILPPGLSAPGHASRPQLRQLRAATDRTARKVAALGPEAMATLTPALVQAERETALALERWLRTVPDGELRYTAQQHAALLLHFRAAFEAIDKLAPSLLEGLADRGALVGVVAARATAAEVARMTAVFEGSEMLLPIDVAAVLSTGESYLIPRFETSAARYAGNVGDDIRRELTVALLRRESVFEMTSRLARHGGPKGVVALRGIVGRPGALAEYIAEGLFRRYRWWGERVARTEISAAFAYQQHAALVQAQQFIPDLKRQWYGADDGRLCKRCRWMHGVIAEIGGPFVSPISGEMAMDPPLHPCCRCTATSYRAAWSQLLVEVKAELAAMELEAA